MYGLFAYLVRSSPEQALVLKHKLIYDIFRITAQIQFILLGIQYFQALHFAGLVPGQGSDNEFLFLDYFYNYFWERNSCIHKFINQLSIYKNQESQKKAKRFREPESNLQNQHYNKCPQMES